MTANNALVPQSTEIAAPNTAVEMRTRLQEMKEKVGLVQAFFRDVMVQGEDYGVIPGTDKPTLLKPGAEKLCEFYGYSIHVSTEREEKDRNTGWYDCAVKVTLISRRTGEVIAEGVGEANTYESRYRYRWVWPEQLPAGVDKNALISRKTKNGKVQYRLENDDLFSLWNTVKKMAKKRALVDAVLSATRSSGIFTQDVEDLREWAAQGDIIEAEYEVHETPREPQRPMQTNRQQQRTNGKSNGNGTNAPQRIMELAQERGWTTKAVLAAAAQVRADGKPSLAGMSPEEIQALEARILGMDDEGEAVDELSPEQREFLDEMDRE